MSKNNRLIVKEVFLDTGITGETGNVKTQREYNLEKDSFKLKTIKSRAIGEGFFSSLFLPEGYPNSVSSDYLRFQFFDTLQALCSYLRGLLSTQAILRGIGVSDSEATVVGATLQWVFRDLFSMVGSILFAWVGGSKFGTDIKKWRFFADCINDIGLTLELIAPIFPSYFLLLASAGSICKAMCGVAAGATRAALTNHFAKSHNYSDVIAKEGIQETAVTLIGMSLGVIFLSWVGESPFETWVAFISLTIFHVIANYQALRGLSLKTINHQRGTIICDHFIDSVIDSGSSKTILNPTEVSRLEKIVWWDPLRSFVHFGSQFTDVVKTKEDLDSLISLSKNKRFLFSVDQKNGGSIHIIMHINANVKDIFEAFFLIRVFLALCMRNTGVVKDVSLHTIVEFTEKHFDVFWNLLSVDASEENSEHQNHEHDVKCLQKWSLEGLSLSLKGWRSNWTDA